MNRYDQVSKQFGRCARWYWFTPPWIKIRKEEENVGSGGPEEEKYEQMKVR